MENKKFYDQAEFDIRCEWGLAGIIQLAPISDVVIIVDVLSFSSSVEIATQRGAIIYPYRGKNAAAYAEKTGALLAAKPGQPGYSLSPYSLSTGDRPTIAGCLRNYAAVAKAAMIYGPRVAVIPAGERWHDEGRTLRPAYEDWIGAGAIISQLNGRLSPEARAARAAFQEIESYEALEQRLRECGSGREHLGRDMADNLPLVAAANVSNCVPLLVDGAYVNMVDE